MQKLLQIVPPYSARFLWALLSVVLLDQASKWWAVQQGWPVQINQGISFGLLPETGVVVGLVSAVILLGVAYWGLVQHRQDQAVLGLFVGGGISNLIDRALVGGVRDWLEFAPLGVRNNLADWAISGAVVLLLLLEIHRWYQVLGKVKKEES